MSELEAKFKVTDKKAISCLLKMETPSLQGLSFHKTVRSGNYFLVKIIDNGWKQHNKSRNSSSGEKKT